MSNTPKIIKLSSSDTLYANKALVDGIKSHLAVSEDLKPGDNIYFFKNVDFKRGLLDTSEISYHRCIKIEKANAVIVNSESSLPISFLGLKDGVVSKDFDLNFVDDVVANISMLGSEMVEVFTQWLMFLNLSNKPRVVFSKNLNDYVNNGTIIDKENMDMVRDLLYGTDKGMALSMLNNCKLEESWRYILYILYFSGNLFNTRQVDITTKYPALFQFLYNKGALGARLGQNTLKLMSEDDHIKSLISAKISKQITELVNNSLGSNFQNLCELVNLDLKWIS